MPTKSVRNLLRARGLELILEAIFIVFAVLVALAVDEWNEGREFREQAEIARTAVISELEGNREELEQSAPTVQAMLDGVTDVVLRLQAGEEVTSADLSGELPDFSDAAWETARTTGVLARMDYEWVLRTARVYETQALTLDLQRDLLVTFGSLAVRAPELERFIDFQGQLAILTMLHQELGRRYPGLLDSPVDPVDTPPSIPPDSANPGLGSAP